MLILKKEFEALFRTKEDLRDRINLLCHTDVKASENKLHEVGKTINVCFSFKY